MSSHFDLHGDASPPENYERYFVPAIGRPLAVSLVGAIPLRAGTRVLDVGCGTGIVARLVVDQVGSAGTVDGVDVNAGMLAVARATDAGAIEWHEGDAESLPFEDGRFDVVFCQLSLQFVEQPSRALREMWRVTRAGGTVAVTVAGPTPPVFAVLAECLGRHVSPQAMGFVNRVFSMHNLEDMRTLMTEAGFVGAELSEAVHSLVLPAPKEFLWQYISGTPLGPLIKDAVPEALDALEAEVIDRWHEFVTENGMQYEQRIVLAKGGK